MKIALEIDGHIFHRNSEKEAERDFLIKKALGEGWDVVHITDILIEKRHYKLMPAILAIVEEHKKNKNRKTGNSGLPWEY